MTENICKIHNLPKTKSPSSNVFLCSKCRSARVDKRRKKLKLLAVEYKGGKCSKCGYDKCIEALDFHHEDPTQKEFGLSSKGMTRSWDKIKTELDKCILVCCRCHREIHSRVE